MLTVAEAQARAIVLAPKLDTVAIALDQAMGRYLAEPTTAQRTQPPFDTTAMDGYAVRWDDLAQRPARLRIIGISQAGGRFAGSVAPGEAVRIFTGAPMPDGADVVVVQEDTQIDSGHVLIDDQGPEHRGAHIRPRGLDFHQGQPLLTKGVRLTAPRLGLLAAAGHALVQVCTRPRVALLSTGDELVPPGAPTKVDQIINSNGPMLSAALESVCADVVIRQIVPDDMATLLAALTDAFAQADMVVTVGGASVGDRDLVKPALEQLGVQLDFWKIAMKPGRPLMAGHLAGKPVFGLPGNPVSAFVTATLFVLPCLRAALGADQPLPPERSAYLAAPCPANSARQDYLRAQSEWREGVRWIMPMTVQDSSMLGTLAAADGLVVRAPNAPAAVVGDRVSVIDL